MGFLVASYNVKVCFIRSQHDEPECFAFADLILFEGKEEFDEISTLIVD